MTALDGAAPRSGVAVRASVAALDAALPDNGHWHVDSEVDSLSWVTKQERRERWKVLRSVQKYAAFMEGYAKAMAADACAVARGARPRGNDWLSDASDASASATSSAGVQRKQAARALDKLVEALGDATRDAHELASLPGMPLQASEAIAAVRVRFAAGRLLRDTLAPLLADAGALSAIDVACRAYRVAMDVAEALREYFDACRRRTAPQRAPPKHKQSKQSPSDDAQLAAVQRTACDSVDAALHALLVALSVFGLETLAFDTAAVCAEGAARAVYVSATVATLGGVAGASAPDECAASLRRALDAHTVAGDARQLLELVDKWAPSSLPTPTSRPSLPIVQHWLQDGALRVDLRLGYDARSAAAVADGPLARARAERATAHDEGVRDSCDDACVESFAAGLRARLPFVFVLQASLLGYELCRSTGLPGAEFTYALEAWQRRMADEIRAHRSVMVVAPTSSGKSFASYYCVQRLLATCETGTMAFVVPSSALVNQVSAVIYGAFNNTFNDTAVWGTFTREYRHGDLKSRVLVMQPECLEILLLSNTDSARLWRSRLQYVVFDEMHHLGDADTGATWERCIHLVPCPVIALSATVSNAEQVCAWMSQVERTKFCEPSRPDVVLVEHAERYSHLRHHTFDADQRRLIASHPWSLLTPELVRAHPAQLPDLLLHPHHIVTAFCVLRQCGVDVPVPPARPLVSLVGEQYPGDARAARSVLLTHRWCRALGDSLYHALRSVDDDGVVSQVIAALGDSGRASQLAAPNERIRGRLATDILSCVDELRSRDRAPTIVFGVSQARCNALAALMLSKIRKQIADEKAARADEITAEQAQRVAARERCQQLAAQIERAKSAAFLEAMEESHNDLADICNRPTIPEIIMMKATLSKAALKRYDERRDAAKLLHPPWRRSAALAELRTLHAVALRFGIGLHHAALPAAHRRLVEQMLRERQLAVVFTTDTLAHGLNMPCRSVVFTPPLFAPGKYLQMAGRAGRRQFDSVGDVVFVGFDDADVALLRAAPLPPICGQFALPPNHVLRVLGVVPPSAPPELSGPTWRDRIASLVRHPLLGATSGAALPTTRLLLESSLRQLRDWRFVTPNLALTLRAQFVTHLSWQPNARLLAMLLADGVVERALRQRDSDTAAVCIVLVSWLCPPSRSRGAADRHRLDVRAIVGDSIVDFVEQCERALTEVDTLRAAAAGDGSASTAAAAALDDALDAARASLIDQVRRDAESVLTPDCWASHELHPERSDGSVRLVCRANEPAASLSLDLVFPSDFPASAPTATVRVDGAATAVSLTSHWLRTGNLAAAVRLVLALLPQTDATAPLSKAARSSVDAFRLRADESLCADHDDAAAAGDAFALTSRARHATSLFLHFYRCRSLDAVSAVAGCDMYMAIKDFVFSLRSIVVVLFRARCDALAVVFGRVAEELDSHLKVAVGRY